VIAVGVTTIEETWLLSLNIQVSGLIKSLWRLEKEAGQTSLQIEIFFWLNERTSRLWAHSCAVELSMSSDPRLMFLWPISRHAHTPLYPGRWEALALHLRLVRGSLFLGINFRV
jgi:hypothetical protein